MTNFPTLPESIEIGERETLYEAIERAESLKIDYPIRPIKPSLSGNSTPDDHRRYADKLEKYEVDFPQYKIDHEIVSDYNQEVDRLIIDLIKHEAGLNNVPEKSRRKVWDRAWDEVHSSGLYGVYQKLEDLVDLFL